MKQEFQVDYTEIAVTLERVLCALINGGWQF